MKRHYGIGADEFDVLVVEQGGVCAICGRDNPEHVDHDHETGKIRGILCFNCNGGLGQFGDDSERLQSASEYLLVAGAIPADEFELHDLVLARARELINAPV